MRSFLSRLRREDGFTMTEVLVATMIAGVIAAITSVAVGTGFVISSQIDKRAVTAVTTTKAMEGLSTNLILANPIDGMSSTTLSMMVARNLVCEKHTYYVASDASTGAPASLNHKVQSIPIVSGTSCADIEPSRWQGQAFDFDRVEVANLTASPDGNPVFAYYSSGGTRVRVPGDSGYSAATDLAKACTVSKIAVTMAVKDPNNDVKIVRSSSTPRATMMGGGQC